MRKVFSSKTSLLIERSGVKLMIIKMVTMIISFGSTSGKLLGQQDLLIRLTKMGKNDNFIRTVNCFVVVKTDINNHKKPNRK